MSDTQLGGGKAVAKTDEDVPVAVDPSTGQLFVPTYPESGGGSGEWTTIYDITVEEEGTAVITKTGLSLKQLEAYFQIRKQDESINVYLTSTGKGTIYGDPRVKLSFDTNYSGGNALLGFEVINESNWRIYSHSQNWENAIDAIKPVNSYFVTKIVNSSFSKEKITEFTLVSPAPFSVGDRIYIRGR